MTESTSDQREFEDLLSYLKSNRGFDFSSYKRTTLERRVQKRLEALKFSSYSEYEDYLEVHQDEYQHLFNTILINVTSFFRDPDPWDYLRDHIVAKLLERPSEEPIRIWVAGCASGEEAFTICMIFAEAMGVPAFRDRVKIYATDLDDDALAQARIASFAPKALEDVPEELRQKYFERVNDHYVFDRELRRSVIFGRHDLIQDAPISRVDLLQCRNTMMYFNSEIQQRILSRFHFALNEGGFLFLGKAETLLTQTSLFVPVDLKNRVFAKAPRSRVRDMAFMFAAAPHDPSGPAQDSQQALRTAAFDSGLAAQVVLDPKGALVMANDRARSLFGLVRKDMGRPIQDLELSYRPIELRSGIEQAYAQSRTVIHKDVVWHTPQGEQIILDLRIIPLAEGSEKLGVSLQFEDVTQYKRLQEELLNFNQELETAYEEVQSTNEELQTTNEELQSTVEELETTNEELQSTNEELETMNEELQSANEELETINEELRQRSEDLNELYSFLESVMSSLTDGVIVLNQDLEILAWNARSEDLWGLRADEVVGRHAMNLDIGLKMEQILVPVRNCLNSGERQTMNITTLTRRGKTVDCLLTVTPLKSFLGDLRGVIILVADTLPQP